MASRTTPKAGTAKAFPRRVMLYENDEGVRLLEALATRRGTSESAVLRQLIREAAKKAGITASEVEPRRIKPGPKPKRQDSSIVSG